MVQDLMVTVSLSRRGVLAGVVAASATRMIAPAAAQQSPPQVFGYNDVVKRARELAAAPFDATEPVLPPAIANLDFDAWRDIRFRSDKPLLGAGAGNFRLELFHLGHLYKRPVVVNVLRDGIPAPIPYASNLFDYGRTKIAGAMPVNLGFAGFRLHFPLNAPHVMDELVAFLGASYYRFLGRGQHYGLSCRGLAIGAGARQGEEFPFFREFWIETPVANEDRITLHALLDSPSLTGAFRFDVTPAQDTFIDVRATLFARTPVAGLNMAPLSSMFFSGANDHRRIDDFRPELHDSDGLLMHTGAGEWIWRPLSNPAVAATSTFLDKNPRGFGLLQRDRAFEHYQDLDLDYELRPSYWIEPQEGWNDGGVQLVELPTDDESNDNIVASWAPRDGLEAGQSATFGYRITALLNDSRLTSGGRVVETFRTTPHALGAVETTPPGATRFLIDFSGGELAYYVTDPAMVEIVATTSAGHVLRTFLSANAHVRGFRAGVDIAVDPGQSTDIRVFLRSGAKALTETWTFPWRG